MINNDTETLTPSNEAEYITGNSNQRKQAMTQKKQKKPKKGGRPPIVKGERRVPFSLSVSQQVKTEIIRVSKVRGCPPGDFVEILLWYYQSREGND